MFLKERHLKLLDLLEKEIDFIPMKYFSNKLYVSSRTISSDIEYINKEIISHGKKIEKKPGVGVKLVQKKEVKPLEENIFIITERKKRIINMINKLLFKNKTITYNQLTNIFYISKTSISNELNYIETILTKGNKLKLVRDNKGTRLAGGEKEFRKAHIEFNNWAIKEILYDQNNSLQVIELFKKYYGESLVRQCYESLYNVMGKDIESIADFYILNVLNSLIVIVYRIHAQKNIEYIEEDKDYNLSLSYQLLEDVFKTSSLNFTKGDVQNLTEYLVSNNFELDKFDYGSKLLPDILKNLKNQFDLTFNMDQTIYNQFSNHISTMIYRLKNGIEITNPLISQIKRKYKKLFNILYIIVTEYEEKLSIKFTEDEIGFLVIYLEATRAHKNKGRTILTVCPLGVASSNLLVKQIEQICEPEDRIQEVSVYDITQGNISDKADLILSTVDLNLPKEKYIKINPILDDESLKKIKKYFVISKEKAIKAQSYENISKYIENKYILMDENFENMSETIEYISKLLITDNRAFEGISNSFKNREELSGTDLRVGVATPHPKPEFVKRSTIVFLQNRKLFNWTNFKVKYIIFICVAKKDLENIKDIFTDIFQIVQTEENVNEFFKFLSSKKENKK